jgi:hypothetical protein
MIPSIGRIVHFIMPDGQHRPAIIVRVWDPKATNATLVQLQVFTDSSNDKEPNVIWRTSVHQDETATKPGTWHEPERV